MANKSGVAEQVTSLPKGEGAIKGIGETFQPDLHTGTGNFGVPIAVSPGQVLKARFEKNENVLRR